MTFTVTLSSRRLKSWYVYRDKDNYLYCNYLYKPQAATVDDSESEEPVDDGSQIALPQYFGSDFYHDPCFMPYGERSHHQAPTNTTSKLIDEGSNFETLTENIIMHYGQCLQGSNKNNKGDPNTIDGFFFQDFAQSI
ncbi:unnamed protein product [Brassica rapa]|uniref:Uncharacterized protein n=1 Tax=Brassica campestris TaxID=3711 RepID=A0A3P5ZS68_BRACM|nr:unnamed protein product [Brassica rapa]VDC83052.1 unnamed protein product [Brassica rapa]